MSLIYFEVQTLNLNYLVLIKQLALYDFFDDEILKEKVLQSLTKEMKNYFG